MSASLQSDAERLLCMVLEMLYVADCGTRRLASGMRTGYFASGIEGFEMLLDVRPKCVLLLEGPGAVSQLKAFIPKAEETLQAATLHGEGFGSLRGFRLHGRVMALAPAGPNRSLTLHSRAEIRHGLNGGRSVSAHGRRPDIFGADQTC